jgi:predicted nucleotidyltransferase component of viral defense system
VKGLAPHTQRIFESVATLECIKPYILVGGTALSIQICTRQSEDLDFMKWRTSKDESPEVDWFHIEKELETIGEIQSRNLLDMDHVEFVLEGVKLSFYSSPKYSPVKEPIPCLYNLRIADIRSIGAMKMEVMMRRSNFRDYYDIYSILKTGIPIWEMIAIAQDYSGHRLKTKNILAILTNGARFKRDERFNQLSPIYQQTTEDIECYIKECLSQSK